MATKEKRFGLRCPFCGACEDATITLDLNDLTACHCSACEEEFTPARARESAAAELARWDALCRWVDSAAKFLPEAK